MEKNNQKKLDDMSKEETKAYIRELREDAKEMREKLETRLAEIEKKEVKKAV